GRLGLLRGLPQDRRAALRRDHGIDAVLQHHHLVRDTDRERAAGAALADHDADDWRPEARHREKIARDRLALTALLRADAGIRSLGIDQRDEGQREFLRELHDAQGLAIALGARHAVVAVDALLRVPALLVADQRDGLS